MVQDLEAREDRPEPCRPASCGAPEIGVGGMPSSISGPSSTLFPPVCTSILAEAGSTGSRARGGLWGRQKHQLTCYCTGSTQRRAKCPAVPPKMPANTRHPWPHTAFARTRGCCCQTPFRASPCKQTGPSSSPAGHAYNAAERHVATSALCVIPQGMRRRSSWGESGLG